MRKTFAATKQPLTPNVLIANWVEGISPMTIPRFFRISPVTQSECESVEYFSTIWKSYPGVAVNKPGYILLNPVDSDHFRWWPIDRVESVDSPRQSPLR